MSPPYQTLSLIILVGLAPPLRLQHNISSKQSRMARQVTADGKERQERLPRAPCAPLPALSERLGVAYEARRS
eukprot:2796092-Pleurochrysis_carterae.AAC.4